MVKDTVKFPGLKIPLKGLKIPEGTGVWWKHRLNLSENKAYKESLIRAVKEELRGYFNGKDGRKEFERIDMENIAEAAKYIRAYPNLNSLRKSPLSNSNEIIEFSGGAEKEHVGVPIHEEDELAAKKVLLSGQILMEHTAAGEATRLDMGPKYCIMPNDMVAKLRDVIANPDNYKLKKQDPQFIKLKDEERKLQDEKIIDNNNNAMVMAISLGNRHMLEQAYRLTILAKEFHKNDHKQVKEVLRSQKMMVILNEVIANDIREDFQKFRFFGFSQRNIYFMSQDSYFGIKIDKGGHLDFEETVNDILNYPRLHNHGQMAMQTAMNKKIFQLGEGGVESDVSQESFGEILRGMTNKLSYPIEDIDYLKGNVIDLPKLALGLELGRIGFRMVMEIVGQKHPPQSGGFWSYDENLGRGVMIESDQAEDIELDKIKYLNKNFNQYPNPFDAWKSLCECSLPLHLTVKNSDNSKAKEGIDLIFPQPPQGDMNFLVPTAFIKRGLELEPIGNLKELADIPATLRAMQQQDKQPGFMEFSEGLRQQKKMSMILSNMALRPAETIQKDDQKDDSVRIRKESIEQALRGSMPEEMTGKIMGGMPSEHLYCKEALVERFVKQIKDINRLFESFKKDRKVIVEKNIDLSDVEFMMVAQDRGGLLADAVDLFRDGILAEGKRHPFNIKTNWSVLEKGVQVLVFEVTDKEGNKLSPELAEQIREQLEQKLSKHS